ncbi:MAG: YchF/TatD family DNA exonuclease [Planctomycetes bacterium]|jgi:TatD DNase family protein|nr:YchF/TatD family DNA exonuclease [Planctomycetota bacterium]
MDELFVDSHAHLDFAEFDADRDAALARAAAAGVRFVLTVGTNLASSRKCLEIAAQSPGVSASVGMHPHDAAKLDAAALRDLEGLARKGAVAIGETGLDYFRNKTPRPAQQEAFRAQLALANRLGLPVIVHSREAWEDTARILREEPPAKGGVVHCFSAGREAAREALAMGLRVSFAGPLTFPNAAALRECAASVPLDRILIETDAPFLAPQGRRGQRNEPAAVVEVAAKQAELHGVTLADAARITAAAARELFGVGPEIPSGLIAYAIRDSLYLNLTGRCSASCVFCRRSADPKVAGYDLRLPAEPTAEEVKAAIREADPRRYREVVFCGFGESTLRLDAVLAVGRWLRGEGHRVRLNTNGTASLIAGRDVTDDLATAVDDLSVSLNAQDAALYEKLCRPSFGAAAYEGLLDFVRKARGKFRSVTLTAVEGVEGVDVEACRRIAEGLGVGFRKRVLEMVG